MVFHFWRNAILIQVGEMTNLPPKFLFTHLNLRINEIHYDKKIINQNLKIMDEFSNFLFIYKSKIYKENKERFPTINDLM